MGFLPPAPLLELTGGVLNVGGAPLGGPPTVGAELIRGGGILLGFKGGVATDEGCGVMDLGGGGGVAAAGLLSF